jgi:low temperature requirement protein LtrA
MDGDSPARPRRRNLRRQPGVVHRATNIELFFDVVYILVVTQLSNRLRGGVTWSEAFHTAVLLGMVWLVWAYTMWVTNWLDPDLLEVRLMLIVLMALSLVFSAGIPQAYGSRGMWIGGSYALMQVGRSTFAVAGLRDDPLQRNFQRILVWCVASGTFAVAGALVHGDARVTLWLVAVLIDVVGGLVGFAVPGLGRSRTTDWTVDGHHIAERCQAFVLIALGESILVIGHTVADLQTISGQQEAAFAAAFIGAIALWWIYFARAADASTDVVVTSVDPGRFARSAYHLVHPIIVAGIILTAAADEDVVLHPTAAHHPSAAWLILGGTALFLLGHAIFTTAVWRTVPWARLAGAVALVALGIYHGGASQLILQITAATVAVAVAASDRFVYPPGRESTNVRTAVESGQTG